MTTPAMALEIEEEEPNEISTPKNTDIPLKASLSEPGQCGNIITKAEPHNIMRIRIYVVRAHSGLKHFIFKIPRSISKAKKRSPLSK